MRNNNLQIDKNFLKVHPDLAALYDEVRAKEKAIKKLQAKKAILKEELKSAKKVLAKRLAVLESWQKKEKPKKAKANGRRRSDKRSLSNAQKVAKASKPLSIKQ